jgi:hypothetical protein
VIAAARVVVAAVTNTSISDGNSSENGISIYSSINNSSGSENSS